MMTSNPRVHNTSDSASAEADARAAGIRLVETERASDNAAWLEDLTIELRLLEVPGAAIGDAVASAREFLADSGARAGESFGSPARYAAELELPTPLSSSQGSQGELLLNSAIGAIGLVMLAQAVFPLAGGDDLLVVKVWMLLSLAGMILALALVPRLMPALVRARPARVLMIALGLMLVGGGPFALVVWQGQAVLFSVPALPIAIGAGILLLAPPIWNEVRHNLWPDPIVEPGAEPDPRPSLKLRLLLITVNWMLVFYGALSVVLTFALYPGK
jgi:hypothetical protein